MKIKFVLLFLILILLNSSILGQNKPSLSEVDRIRLAEAFRLNDYLSDKLWKDWNKVPFAVLLTTPEYEFLIRHPKPSEDFTLIGYDSLLKSDVYFRKGIFPTTLLAAFPAVGGITTVVVGQAENTASKTSTPWIVTLMHEHFHQLQDSQPNISNDTLALNLTRGDKTGGWMLNYAFPYDSPEVKQQFVTLARSLADTLQAKNKTDFSRRFAAYMTARQQLQKMLSADDYKYLSFQLWKEGIARYTEYQVAKLAATKYESSKEFRQLKDFTSFESVAQKMMSRIIEELTTLQLDNYKRVAFYPIGAGEGLLLDRLNPKWSNQYFAEKFYLEKYFNNGYSRSSNSKRANLKIKN